MLTGENNTAISRESDSISNQRILIQEYLKEHPEMELVEEWVDDGYSGSSFERPGVSRMLQAAREERIDCILVKDLSRFGREYIQTGRYLQRMLPDLGVRFIAICDGYDSERTEFMEEALLLPVMNLMNDAYCRDISRKVRCQQAAKRRQGDYVGAFAVYGYRKAEQDHNKLVRDEPAAQVVEKIFYWRKKGNSAEKICGFLNSLLIPSPYCYKKMNHSNYTSGFAGEDTGLWSPVAVRRILKNEMYTGVMIQGKDRKISYKVKRRVRISREDWICVPGAVPVIVEPELFQEVQTIKSRRGRKKSI